MWPGSRQLQGLNGAGSEDGHTGDMLVDMLGDMLGNEDLAAKCVHGWTRVCIHACACTRHRCVNTHLSVSLM